MKIIRFFSLKFPRLLLLLLLAVPVGVSTYYLTAEGRAEGSMAPLVVTLFTASLSMFALAVDVLELTIKNIVYNIRNSKEMDGRVGEISRIEDLFDLVGRLVPAKLSNEELGDAQEQINSDLQAGKSRFRIWLKALSAVFWVLVNALREVMSAVFGRPRPN